MKMEKIENIIPHYNELFRALLIFGPPGSGKGTLGKFLSSAGNHFHLSSGDIFRSLSPDSPAGKLYHRYASKGLLLPDEIAIQIWYHFVHGLIATNRYFPTTQFLLLDGIPRTLQQAHLLERYTKIEKIILLEIEDEQELMKRMQLRGVIQKRSDDLDPKILETRMGIYRRETLQLLQRYPKKAIISFNATQKPLALLRDVLVALSDLL